MRYFLLLFLLVANAQADTRHPVILLSIDGFAYDYLKKYQPKNINALASKGAVSKGLIPVFPTKTFPNHLTLVTGVYPSDHGIVHNKFYHRTLKKRYTLGAGKNNPNWLTAKPIWAHAQENGLKTAIYFWPESETKVDGLLPDYFYPYQHNTPNLTRVQQIIDWLKLPDSKRPRFIASYFSTVDSAGHTYGVDGEILKQEIEKIDELIGLLIDKIKTETKATPNIILVSDHGMVSSGEEFAIHWKQELPALKNLHVVNGQTQLYVYESDKKTLNDVRSQLSQKQYQGKFQAFTKESFPSKWRFSKNSPVIPDMVINAIAPHTFVDGNGHIGRATHGFDPAITPEMKALFIASGPNIKSNVVMEEVENIHIYALLEHLLALPQAKGLPSKISAFKQILQKP